MKHVALSSEVVQAANSAKDVRDILLVVEMALDSVEGTLEEEQRRALDHVVGLALNAAREAVEAAELAGKLIEPLTH